MRYKLSVFIFILIMINNLFYSVPTELNNLITFKNLEDNPLIGYGLVIGLKGTGDSVKDSEAQKMISQIANNFGYNTEPSKLKTKNTAVVLVTATLPALSQVGDRIDLKVSSIYDAKSLEGGELFLTKLMGGDNKTYVIGQGNINTFNNKSSVTGIVPMGGIIQNNQINSVTNENGELTLILTRNIGFNAINIIASELNNAFTNSVKRIENNSVVMSLPKDYELSTFITEILKTKIDIDEEPNVLIDSQNGIIISGGNVIISEAAISINNTKINVGSSSFSSFSSGYNDTTMKYIGSTTSVQQLADGMNKLGVSTDDIINILKLLYENGNLKGKLTIK